VHFLGVSIAREKLSFPRAIAKSLPVLVFGRVSRPLAELDEITSVGPLLKGECVILSFDDARYSISFNSRETRLAFFETIRAQNANVKIYRAH
jgi:hypothetical protein